MTQILETLQKLSKTGNKTEDGDLVKRLIGDTVTDFIFSDRDQKPLASPSGPCGQYMWGFEYKMPQTEADVNAIITAMANQIETNEKLSCSHLTFLPGNICISIVLTRMYDRVMESRRKVPDNKK